MSTILTPENAPPRCTATVRLISRVFRPYLFEVLVVGEYPHRYRVTYKIAAPDDDSAALKGLQLFTDEFLPWVVKQKAADLIPKAVRQ